MSTILRIQWSLGIICMLCQLVSLSIPWSLVGRQVSKSILDKAKMGSGEEEGKFHGSTTMPECSEDRTAVPSLVKMESELCICPQHVSIPPTHTFEGLQR